MAHNPEFSPVRLQVKSLTAVGRRGERSLERHFLPKQSADLTRGSDSFLQERGHPDIQFVTTSDLPRRTAVHLGCRAIIPSSHRLHQQTQSLLGDQVKSNHAAWSPQPPPTAVSSSPPAQFQVPTAKRSPTKLVSLYRNRNSKLDRVMQM